MTPRSRPVRVASRAAAVAAGTAVSALLLGCTSPGSATPVEESPRTSPPSTDSPSGTSPAVDGAQPEGTGIEITIDDGQVVTGVLWDNATSRSLISQLPLTLTFSDHSRLEKTGALPQSLSMDGMPEGDDPRPNDIGYYAPSSDVVFYYGDVGYWTGIARIGEFTSDIAPIQTQATDFTATITLAG